MEDGIYTCAVVRSQCRRLSRSARRL